MRGCYDDASGLAPLCRPEVRVCSPYSIAGQGLDCVPWYGVHACLSPIIQAGRQVPGYQVATHPGYGGSTYSVQDKMVLALGTPCTTTLKATWTDLAFTSPFANGNSNPTAQLTRLWNHHTGIALPETASPPTPQSTGSTGVLFFFSSLWCERTPGLYPFLSIQSIHPTCAHNH
jgi:hypothetical protein